VLVDIIQADSLTDATCTGVDSCDEQAPSMSLLQHELAVLSSDGEIALEPSSAKASFNMRGSWLALQEANRACDPALDPHCSMESAKVLVLLISLSATIVIIICAFSFFREDREEQITPLCPQLVVKDSELKFRLPAPGVIAQVETTCNMDVMDNNDNCVCKISMDWPDPFRGTPHGVAATVRIHKSDMTLATIVARNVAVLGQGLALCRTGCEIFGFVEPEGNKYHVRHRTGVHLLTLIGSFENWDIEGVNPVGTKVCSMKKVGDECIGKVSQHVDAGLVICALMATYVHRRLSQPWSSTSGPPRPMPALGVGAPPVPAAAATKAASCGDQGSCCGKAAEEQGAEQGGASTDTNLGLLPARAAIDISQFRSPTTSTRDTRLDPEPVTSSSAPASGTGTPATAG